jgi:hypothetical protein
MWTVLTYLESPDKEPPSFVKSRRELYSLPATSEGGTRKGIGLPGTSVLFSS